MSTLKEGKKVYIVEQELGGTEIIKCKVIKSHLGTVDDDDDEPYPDEDYDVMDDRGVIWDFVCREDLYTSLKAAKEDF